MVNFITHISVAQAATIMNALIAVIQLTFGLALVVILIYVMHNIHSALTWSVITRYIHSSLWPTLLRTDSAASTKSGYRISFISVLSLVSTIVITVASVITPLGLKEGPSLQSTPKSINTTYLPDTSPIGLATSPRTNFSYSRICGAFGPVPCPGNRDDTNTSAIAPSIMEKFSSTNHGTFNMQFRRYYQGTGGYNYSMALSDWSILQSLVLRNDIFAISGLIVDMTLSPGIGLWNNTIPVLQRGGAWSHEVLWLEPITSCVNTNLTLDYALTNNADPAQVDYYNLTDRGGFVDLTTVYPTFSRDGQHINIRAHAYKAAVLTNFNAMRTLNVTHGNDSYIGRVFTLNNTQTDFFAGLLQPLALTTWDHLSGANTSGLMIDLDTSCSGYGGLDTANITNVSVHCSLLLGPPERTDGGDPRVPADNSTWRQSIHACASATQARLQNVQFSLNGTLDLSDMHISRQNTNTPVLWAVENTTLHITDVDIFWGQIADSYKDDPSLTTFLSETFYLPAGSSDTWEVPAAGQPSTIPAIAWSNVYGTVENLGISYSGQGNIALLTKWQALYNADPINGPAQMNNLIWTDMVANTLVGTDTAGIVDVAAYEPSLSYDFRYSIPAFLSLAMWLPIFLSAAVILLAGALRISHMRHLLNQTSLGRIVVGDSTLAMVNNAKIPGSAEAGSGQTSHLCRTSDWVQMKGSTLVAFDPRAPGARSDNGGSKAQTELLLETDELAAEQNGFNTPLDEAYPNLNKTTALRKVLADFANSPQSRVATPSS